MAETLRFTVENGVGWIVLDRPEARNAMNAEMRQAYLDALQRCADEPEIRAVVLTATGNKGFCTGADLRSRPAATGAAGPPHPGATRDAMRPSQRVIRALWDLEKPIIAAVNGVAAGAGMSLALACDFRVAVDTARFVAAFANVGLVPDTGMSYLLPRLIGYARALELCMLGGTLDAVTAHSYGMLNVVATSADFPGAVRQLAERLANGPAVALGLTKRAFELAQHATFEQTLEYEAQAQQIAGAGAEYAEGVAAFREKRPASFR